MKRLLVALALVTLTALAVAVPAGLAKSQTQIALHPGKTYPHAKGSAQYQAQPGQRELQIEVEHIRPLRGTLVRFYVAGHKVGSARVNRRGKAELSRNTERGQRVPRVRPGTRVLVRTRRHVLIVAGTF